MKISFVGGVDSGLGFRFYGYGTLENRIPERLRANRQPLGQRWSSADMATDWYAHAGSAIGGVAGMQPERALSWNPNNN